MRLARPSVWLACVVLFWATAAALAQSTTRPAPPPAKVGQFEKQALERPAGSTAGTREPATRPVQPSTTMGTFRVVAALALVIVVIFLLRWIAQQFFGMPGAKKSSRAVQVLSRSMISPKQQIVLLQVGKRVIVVGDNGGQMHPLAEITDPDEIASLAGQLQEDKPTSPAKSFGNLFGKAQTKYDADDELETPSTGPKEEVDPSLASTQAELSGLMEKIKNVAAGMKKPSSEA